LEYQLALIAAVLNAFRHHGIGHEDDEEKPARALRCSTPSGIMESVTPANAAGGGSAACAQRLPASWNRSPVCEHYLDAGTPCSTPSGIMESVTGSDRRYGHFPNVLNAFRHHGIGHAAEWQERRKGVACSTPSGIMESVTCHLDGDRQARRMCSTPSGIMESVTRSGARRLGGGFVLNAFRHHGIGHDLNRLSDAAIQQCSTPSGIMESVTLADAITQASYYVRCSTPSGIMESVTIRPGPEIVFPLACSTPSGIMESVTVLFRPA